VRGDGRAPAREVTAAEGSPPRARGRPAHGRGPGRRAGITPACAGTADAGRPGGARGGDHPRVRGDGASTDASRNSFMGSPPRARGRRQGSETPRRGGGITPACAGTAVQWMTSVPSSRDHPRVRGDGITAGEAVGPSMGSPPRARGRLRHGAAHRVVRGITPACAGTAREPDMSSHIHLGSPPRARGRPAGPEVGWVPLGITPACAGTACSRGIPETPSRDHPRVRGDGVDGHDCNPFLSGSPPRARGRPSQGRDRC